MQTLAQRCADVRVYAGRMADDLDRDSPVPLYQQLAAELRRRIAEEKLTRLPSWRTLCEQYDVSRPVAEKAVGILKDAGEVFTVNGKGTYVGPRPE